MYSNGTGIVYGFHGCDQSIADKIINKKIELKPSQNKYDWLGNGMYFWENSPSRALEFANHLKFNPYKSKGSIEVPAVIGAVIHLGNCLDLLDFENLKLLKGGFDILEATSEKLPINKKIPKGNLSEMMLRELDCAVIETLHKVRQDENLRSYDSVRGVFWEGDELYPSAGFREKDHIQLCIRNPNCIKGFFYPREENSKFHHI